MPTYATLGRRTVLAGVAGAVLADGAYAQTWPDRPVTLVVPFAPGGGTDTFARPFAARLSQQLGQQVVIDNRAGAGGTVGAAMVAKAKPDGYTLLLGSIHHAVAVSAYKRLSYDLEKDLLPITGVAYVPDVLVIYPEIPARTLQEFVAYCKANPGKVNYGSAGLGTTRHLAGEIFNARTGAGMTHIPYKGTGPATAALMSGEVAAVFEGLGSASAYIRSGKIRALAVFSAKRSPAFPDIPTAAEAGLANFESLSWYGLWAPAGTPAEIVASVRKEVARAFESPELKQAWLQQGAEAGGEPTAQFGEFVRVEIGKWGKVVRDNNIVIE
ncbi:MAG: tripartite tricarboxylate transporter substrate binding protein [Alphaproteobacteria bacterium]|nr:tripartite tricarboxylate transporter substrate binding protein [Alphaproteobacteria bacterium]